MSEQTDPVAAWTRAAEAEAATAFAYATLGPLLPDEQRTRTVIEMIDHERARDDAMSRAVAAGGSIPVLPSAFDIPGPPDSVRGIEAEIGATLSRLVAVYADVVAGLPSGARRTAIGRALTVTNRALSWQAMPGPWGPEPAPAD